MPTVTAVAGTFCPAEGAAEGKRLAVQTMEVSGPDDVKGVLTNLYADSMEWPGEDPNLSSAPGGSGGGRAPRRSGQYARRGPFGGDTRRTMQHVSARGGDAGAGAASTDVGTTAVGPYCKWRGSGNNTLTGGHHITRDSLDGTSSVPTSVASLLLSMRLACVSSPKRGDLSMFSDWSAVGTFVADDPADAVSYCAWTGLLKAPSKNVRGDLIA